MSPKDYVTSVLRQYATFSGRASRPEYWWFQLALWLSIIVAFILLAFIPVIGILIYIVVVFGSIIPNVAVSARRLHDTNKSGWYQLLGFVPLLGMVALIVLYTLPSDRGDNQYGSPPHTMGNAPGHTVIIGTATPMCPSCGSTIGNQTRFCPSCGHRISEG